MIERRVLLMMVLCGMIGLCGCATGQQLAGWIGGGVLSSQGTITELGGEDREVGPQTATDRKRLESLEKKIKKNKSDVPLRMEAAKLLVELRNVAGDDWAKRAVDHYQAVINLNPENAEARWEMASVLEYGGLYSEAVPHYKWMTQAATVAPQLKAGAKAHLITCEFMARLEKNSKSKKSKTQAAEAERLKSLDQEMKKYNVWGDLRDVVGAVAITAGLIGVGGRDRHIQVAIGYLDDWSYAPSGEKVEARNRFLAGMVSVLASIVAEKKLGVQVIGVLERNGRAGVDFWPEAGYAGAFETEFKKEVPQKGRKYEISKNLAIVEKWDVPNISGTWLCQFTEVYNSYPAPEEIVRPSGYVSYGKIRFQQNGGEVIVTFPESPDSPSRPASLTGRILNGEVLFGWMYSFGHSKDYYGKDIWEYRLRYDERFNQLVGSLDHTSEGAGGGASGGWEVRWEVKATRQ